MPVSKRLAIQVAMDAIGNKIRHRNVLDGWPLGGGYFAGCEPVWSVPIPSLGSYVGGTHYIVVSQTTGMVVQSGMFGE